MIFAGTSSATAVSGRPLTSGGKPEVFYVASEFCPYCTGRAGR